MSVQPTTNQLILNYISAHPMVPPRQIARALNLSVTDVRYHLQHLRKAKEVEMIMHENTGQPGRPACLFRLPPQCNLSAYKLLTNALLSILQQSGVDRDFHDLASVILPPEITREASPVVRITKIVHFLNAHGYHARWEARPQFPQLEFRQCPYVVASSDKNDFCLLDQALLEISTGYKTSRIKFSPCLFQIHLDQPV